MEHLEFEKYKNISKNVRRIEKIVRTITIIQNQVCFHELLLQTSNGDRATLDVESSRFCAFLENEISILEKEIETIKGDLK